MTHACLGNHEFDHSARSSASAWRELDAEVVNTNVFACPEGEEHVTKDATRRALANAVPYPEASAPAGFGKWRGAFLDEILASIVDVGGVRIAASRRMHHVDPDRPRVSPKAWCSRGVPLAKAAAKALLPNVDAVVALTHQTLPEDTRLAEEVPELAAILGGHEHTPFAGRMEHGANAAARIAQHRTASSKASSASRAAHGASTRNPGRSASKPAWTPRTSSSSPWTAGAWRATAARVRRGRRRRRTGCDGGRARATAVADAARAHHDEFGAGAVAERPPQDSPEEFGKDAEDDESCAFESE